MNRRALLPAFACIAACTAAAPPCAADDDGAYGRIDGDLTLQVDLGAGFRRADPGAWGGACARYLDTAGLYFSAFQPGSKPHDTPRTVSAGVELRPLFLPRFLKNMEHGPAVLDLAIDSVALRLGAFWPSVGPQVPGLEGALLVGVPLSAHTAGPWLRLGAALQWSSPRLAFHAHGPVAHLWTLSFAWQGLLDTGLVDLDDRSAR